MSDISKGKLLIGSGGLFEIADLVKELEEKWGVSAAPAAEVLLLLPEEVTLQEELQLKRVNSMLSHGAGEINAVIKEVRALTDWTQRGQRLVEGA